MTVVDGGLATATRDSFFLANLFTVKGEVLRAGRRARQDRLARRSRAGDHALRQQAIVVLDRSIHINDALQAADGEPLMPAGRAVALAVAVVGGLAAALAACGMRS